nr:acetylxylan esterase [bacterium]
MPLIDMPLEQLRTYQGISPCPHDLDAYWSRALKQMRAVDPKVTLTPAEFQAPGVSCFDLTFTGVDGARIYAKYLRPKAAGRYPAVLQFHGYTGNSGDWSDKLAYVSAGFAVAAMDCRGQGGKSQDVGGVSGNTMQGQIIRGVWDGPEKLLFRSIYLDTVQLAGIVMGFDEVDETRVGAMGGSQGGALTIACAALEPRIRRAAPMYPFLCDFRRVWEMDLCKDAYEEFNQYFRRFDPTHEHEDAFFNTLSYIDLKNLAPRIRARVLQFTGLMDTVCPPSTQFSAYNAMTCPKDMVLYPDFGHEGLPGASDKTFRFMMGLLG